MQLCTTILPLVASFSAMLVLRPISYWLALAVAPIAAGFFIRTFILMHDCAHGSFTPSRRANEIIGFWTGVLTLMPFGQWRRDHAIHHASSGDLDRRGFGDIDTLTIDEYLARNWWGRFKYRAFRNPLVLFGGGPFYFLLLQRFQTPGATHGGKRMQSVYLTNAAIALVYGSMFFAFGTWTMLSLFMPVYYLATSVGIFLFYVQHQFEGTYWETHSSWNYGTAALQGSSYYRLPKVLEWITGSIGLHHVHHTDPKIPNYMLRRCHEASEDFRSVPELTLLSSLRSVKLKLWDPQQRRLVGFDAVAGKTRGKQQRSAQLS